MEAMMTQVQNTNKEQIPNQPNQPTVATQAPEVKKVSESASTTTKEKSARTFPRLFKLKSGKHRFVDPSTGKKETKMPGDKVLLSEAQYLSMKDKFAEIID
jgi:hypothetical protein